MQRVHRRRIEAAIDIWSMILKDRFGSREELVKYLRKVYERASLEPIRGRSKLNAYDKELVTVYLVGKYGLGIDYNEYEGVVERLLGLEARCERALDEILAGAPAREAILRHLGSLSEDAVFRVIRLAYVAALLEFRREEDLIRLLARLEEEFPEYEKKLKGFKKYYVAFRIAEAIAAGEIRNRLEKEAYKHALCMRLNAAKLAPPDDQIRFIATEILGVKEFEVNDVLRMEGIELQYRPAR